MTEKSASKRMITQSIYSTIVPQQVICELIGGGVAERYPDLHFALIEFNAHWLASLVGAHGQVLDHRHRPGRRLVARRLGRDPPAEQQAHMAQLFRLNEKWPYPLMPSEYVRRQFHVSFQDDPVAVACRHITGLSTIVWGNDYPHAEGTFRGSRQLIAEQFAGVPTDERDAMVGGTLGGLLGFKAPGRRLRGRTPERAPLRRPRRRRHRRRAGDRARLRAACWPQRGASVVVNDLGGSMEGTGADAGPAADVVGEIEAAGGSALADTSDVATAAGAQAVVEAAVATLRASRHPDQQRRHHPLGRPSRGRRGQPGPASGGAHGRLVQHRPRRVAAHGRAAVTAGSS